MEPPKRDDLELLYRYVGSDFEPTPPDDLLVSTYQQIHGLRPDGFLGPATSNHLRRPRFCAVPDRLPQGTARARWDNTRWTGSGWKDDQPRALELTYFVPRIPGLSQQAANDGAAEGLSWWSDICAIEFRRVDDPSSANILAESGRIDGPGSTLAWMYLPMGRETAQSQLKGLFDNQERWSLPFFREVWAHEFGHAIGLEHGGKGLMQPFHTDGARLDEWAVKEAVLRYGPPVTVGPPPIPEDPTNVHRFTIPEPGVYQISKVG